MSDGDSGPARGVLSPRVIVRASRGWRWPSLHELWHYRELLGVLAARDLKVRYRETVLGIAWAIVQPLFTMILFTMIAHFANLSTDGVRPELFYYCGMLPWLLFANGVTAAGNSLLGAQHLVTKVYFPRLIVPASSVITALVDFGIAFIAFLALMPFYGVLPGVRVLFVPAFVALATLATVGFGFWLSALNSAFRDVRHMVPFAMQLWLLSTPILYSSSSVHGWWKRVLLALNPMSGIVEGFRWAMLGSPAPGPALAVSIGTTALVLATSLLYFHRVDRTLADRF